MTICRVLRCQQPGTAVIADQELELPVCETHHRRINAGEAWDFNGARVLMGNDLPPQLARWTVRDNVGSQGLQLTLETERDGDIRDFTVLMTPEQIEKFSMIFSARGSKQSLP